MQVRNWQELAAAGPIICDGVGSDGRELYFMDTEPDLKVMAVDISTSPGVQAGAPRVLFHVPGDAQGDLGTTRYISRDGQQFVFVLPAP